MNNVANLHVAMAIDNCEWFEVLAFNRTGDHSLEHLSYGLAGPGHRLPRRHPRADRPRARRRVDWELIDASVTQIIS